MFVGPDGNFSRTRSGGAYLLLVTPPAPPDAIIKIVPALTAPFLPTDPAGDVLHVGHCSACLGYWLGSESDMGPAALGGGEMLRVEFSRPGGEQETDNIPVTGYHPWISLPDTPVSMFYTVQLAVKSGITALSTQYSLRDQK